MIIEINCIAIESFRFTLNNGGMHETETWRGNFHNCLFILLSSSNSTYSQSTLSLIGFNGLEFQKTSLDPSKRELSPDCQGIANVQ